MEVIRVTTMSITITLNIEITTEALAAWPTPSVPFFELYPLVHPTNQSQNQKRTFLVKRDNILKVSVSNTRLKRNLH